MCLVNVKEEEDFMPAARYKRTTRVRRYSPAPSIPRSVRYSRTSYVEERQPSHHSFPPPSRRSRSPTVIEPPRPPSTLPSAPSAYGSTHIESTAKSRRTSHAPSVHSTAAPSTYVPTHVESAAKTRRTSRAPSVRSAARSHYVEVEPESESEPEVEVEPEDESSSASSISEDVRSKTTSHTRKSSQTKASSHTRQSSHSKAPTAHTSPRSEYSIHEREHEFRRERGYSRPRDEYETYRYVNAPPDAGRSSSRSGSHDPRASRETRIVIEDGRIRRH